MLLSTGVCYYLLQTLCEPELLRDVKLLIISRGPMTLDTTLNAQK